MEIIKKFIDLFKIRKECLEDKSVLEKLKKKNREFIFAGSELKKIEKNIKNVKKERYQYDMNHSLDELL